MNFRLRQYYDRLSLSTVMLQMNVDRGLKRSALKEAIRHVRRIYSNLTDILGTISVIENDPFNSKFLKH